MIYEFLYMLLTQTLLKLLLEATKLYSIAGESANLIGYQFRLKNTPIFRFCALIRSLLLSDTVS